MTTIAPERLLHVIEAHASAEEEHMAGYRELARTAKDPVVALLVDLVIEDEERHHDLLHRMAGRLHNDIEWTHTPGAIDARLASDPGAGNLAVLTREYAQEEHEGARKLRQLAKDGAMVHGGLFSLLLETMAQDSEKHEKIMKFVVRRLCP